SPETKLRACCACAGAAVRPGVTSAAKMANDGVILVIEPSCQNGIRRVSATGNNGSLCGRGTSIIPVNKFKRRCPQRDQDGATPPQRLPLKPTLCSIAQFDCSNCGAKYKVVRIEVPPQSEREVTCLSCGAPFHTREGKFALKYVRIDHPKGGRRSKT